MIFKDRVDAGVQLAEKLKPLAGEEALVLAIPRGGVVVGAEIARRLGLELDLIIPRKVGAPHNPEVAVGAVTQDGTAIFNRPLIDHLGISEFELIERVSSEIKEIERRMTLYRGYDDYPDLKGRQLILADDGVATGYTVFAALRFARNPGPSELILAVPVSPPDTLEQLKKEADRVVCLVAPENFYAVGQFYERFEQVGDGEVLKIMREFKKEKGDKKAAGPK